MPDIESRSTRPLWRRLRTAPRRAERDALPWRLADLAAGSDAALRAHLDRPRVRALLLGIADHSSYLWSLIEADPGRLSRVLDEDPQALMDAILADLGMPRADEDEAGVMHRLRLAKQEVALLVALADLGGLWRLEEVVRALSRAADAFIREALAHLLREASRAGTLVLSDAALPESGCGMAVLALGKLGGCELNYSSDVDLVVVFDAESPAIVQRDTAKARFVRIAQGLVRLLQRPTGDGYVLRIDLRLRPDPGSTAVAISLDAAFRYYEAYGQNWERAAMIKARVVAGDRLVGQTFIDGLAPFVWRKFFDFAAIADIHAMKRQIHVVKGHAEIAVAGHDVKLGRGGIREIEFFVQTQQLIFGGKRPDLRGARTLPMLRQLRRDGWIGARAVSDLTRAYAFLRRIEHRLQMLADEQTHRLPLDPVALERFARFCGLASAERFAAVLTCHLRRVVHHYALLFESETRADPAVHLVFAGIEDDPDTIATLASLGYTAPVLVAAQVRDWQAGRRLAVRSSHARETLTDLVPRLLVTFAGTSHPDGAVAAFDAALDRIPAGGELFALLAAKPSLRGLFSDILGSAPCLAAEVILRPHLLDAAIDPASAISLDADVMTSRLAASMRLARTTEEALDRIRDLRREEHFFIGVSLLSGEIDPDAAGRAYTSLAEGVVRVLLDALLAGFEREHGRIDGGALAILGMGKLGAREMTATSDLDLVLIYDCDPDATRSDGPRPLYPSHYFARLTQRLVSYLTVATRRGGLYQVDMRLRPSGNQGPLATKLSAFSAYQRDEAATWERMALTRARVIAGDARLGARVARELTAIFRRPAGTAIGSEIAAMRALIAREKPAASDWDLKLAPGGLIDIEFIAQGLVLRHAAAAPDMLDPGTRTILARAGAMGLLDKAVADRLTAAHRLFSATTQILRLALDEGQSPEATGKGVTRSLALATGSPDMARLAADLAASRQAVREIFGATVGIV